MRVPVPITCTVPDCREPAVRQWQREATGTEAAAHRDGFAANVTALTESRRLNVRLSIAQLEHAATNLPATVDGETMRSRLAGAVKDLEAELASISDTPLPAETTVMVTVHGCETHAVGEDAATVLHAPDCHTAGPCGCDLDIPVTSGG